MIFDSHMHTKFSADSKMLATDAINRANELQLGIVFTEHFDYDIPLDVDFTFDPDEYFAEYQSLRSSKLRLGVEIGLENVARKPAKDFVKRVPFDLVIGSIHIVDRFDIYYPNYYEGKDKLTAYGRYFDAMIEEVAVGDFDVLAHIDYICRTAPYENPEIDYETFKSKIDEVLKILVERDKILELNTRRLNTERGLIELIPIFNRYKELGGQYITIGSDAHRVEVIGNYFNIAKKFADEMDLQVVTFCNRQLEFCD